MNCVWRKTISIFLIALIWGNLARAADPDFSANAQSDPYRVLGVDSDSPIKEIKRRWRALAGQYFTDHATTEAEREAVQEISKKINAAYTEIQRLEKAGLRKVRAVNTFVPEDFAEPNASEPPGAESPRAESPRSEPPQYQSATRNSRARAAADAYARIQHQTMPITVYRSENTAIEAYRGVERMNQTPRVDQLFGRLQTATTQEELRRALVEIFSDETLLTNIYFREGDGRTLQEAYLNLDRVLKFMANKFGSDIAIWEELERAVNIHMDARFPERYWGDEIASNFLEGLNRLRRVRPVDAAKVIAHLTVPRKRVPQVAQRATQIYREISSIYSSTNSQAFFAGLARRANEATFAELC